MSFSEHAHKQQKSHFKKIMITVAILLIVAIAISVFYVRKTYSDNLLPKSNADVSHVITVEPGSTTAAVADTLATKGAIRSDWAFEWYVRNHDLRDKIKAGTYVVKETQSIPEIVDDLVEGRIASDLVTIIPGQRIDQIKTTLVKAGFTEADVDAALDAAQWADHPALTDKPADASLEGYLYPESFQKTAETTPRQVVQLALDEMEARLTPEVRQAITKQGLTLHQGVILASIIEREVTNPEDRAQVAQLFIKRLKDNIRLQSNATDDYAKIDSSYNTYTIAALPPGPISNLSESALQSVAFPAQTDWLYFVSGDDGKTHFSKTLQEHEKLVQQYCTTACGN